MFLEKVRLITIVCDSLTLIFFNIISSNTGLPILQHDQDFKGGERKFLLKRWNEDRTLLLVNRAVKTSWLAVNFL